MRRAIAENRVIEVDGEGDLEAIEGKEAGFLVSVLDGHGPLDADELFCRGLLLDPADWIRNTKGPALPSMIGTSLALTST
jgi:hypothetical protein